MNGKRFEARDHAGELIAAYEVTDDDGRIVCVFSSRLSTADVVAEVRRADAIRRRLEARGVNDERRA